ncbi:MAG TPA: DUF2017 family protein [Chthoniobacteraceae bacterium]|jgi:hypothetical protein|nr:hypothetical protein [Chthoniobacter sp.]HEV7867689.1 DUF2017 family protein [Chthoniobacteraceae bacterium]
MTLNRIDENTIALEEVDPFCADLLEQIVPNADPGDDPAARNRIYSSPTHGADPEADDEWKEYVEPELRILFRDALEVVRSDLENLSPPEPALVRHLHLPLDHLEAWIHALNQARLVLSTRFQFGEHEMERLVPTGANDRSLALLRVHLYGALQEYFLQQLD